MKTVWPETGSVCPELMKSVTYRFYKVQKAQKVPQYQTIFQISCKIYLVFASLGKGMAASGLKEAAD